MIDPTAVSTIRVGELSPEPFSLTDNVPHEVGTELKRGTIEDLATFISAFIGSTDGVGFRAISVTDGQTLPTTTQQEFILVGKGTYYNVVGGSTIICTEELNAIVSNGSYWFIGVEIPVNVELAGITQFIRDGFISTTPSEDAVFDALALKANVADSENIANKQNDLTPDGTGTKYPTVDAVNADVVKLLGDQTISDKKAFNKISVGTPTSDVIGHPSDSFNADLSIRGSGVRIENTTGESLIVNTTAYAGGSHFYDANVLAIQNKSTYLGVLSQVPSAIRFLSNTDGEMGAIGYQNGAVGTAFANSIFIAASMPYYPSNPLVAPTRLALIQEGDYLGALTKVERLEFNSDWSTKFKTPNGTPRITIPVEGRVLINNATDNLTDDLQINGSIKATTLKGNSLTSNLVLKATTNGQITNSTITDNGTNVGIGNASTSPAENLEVRTTGNAGFAMTRNETTNLSRFYFKTGSTYNWSTGIRNTRNDYSVFNEVSSLEAFTINATTNNVLIGTTTDVSSSKLTISSTTQGVLLPRMTTSQINAISSPVKGLTVFNTDLDTLCFYTTSWQKVTSTTM